MSTAIGTFEHADHTEPRLAHGYCTDDVARVLIAVCRERAPAPAVTELARMALRFLTEAQGPDGSVHNRRSAAGMWEDEPSVEDCWGRSVWAVGTAVRGAPEAPLRQIATGLFERGIEARSSWPRAMTFAALGASEVLQADPGHEGARLMLADAVDAIGPLGSDSTWPWPEPRLTYANATIPQVLIAAGSLLGRSDVLAQGLELLGWLLDRETVDGHLSPTPVGGAGPQDRMPGFDQQPIEAATMADACAHAAGVTGDERWLRGLDLAIGWFAGANDAGTVMWDPSTGGGYDGLHATGPNLNQGAESTLALITTLQHARSPVASAR